MKNPADAKNTRHKFSGEQVRTSANQNRGHMVRARWIVVCLIAVLPLGSAPAQLDPVDCEGPAPEAEAGTVEWTIRDASNAFCAEQRHVDQTQHPVAVLAAPPSNPLTDGYRDPSRHNGTRFRMQTFSVGSLVTDVYRPCAVSTCVNMPSTLPTFEPPYPAVLILHGLGGRRDEMWWASQALAEAGYLVASFDGESIPDPTSVLEWLLADDNPYRDELDHDRIGIAGTSAGAGVAMQFGQQDARISAIVAWDGPGDTPDDLPARAPALFFVSDYTCYPGGVCQPRVYQSPPDPEGPGEKGMAFERLRAAGVDSMKLALRAALHFDFISGEVSGNRYAEIVSLYYSVAWFDRYLKGATDPTVASAAYGRLIAQVFDGSADRHNISQGIFDPARAVASADLYGGNVPYALEGMPVADRLSFYYLSKCDVSVPGSSERAASEDIRSDGCRM